MELVLIHPEDSVEVYLDNGHKYARRDISAGERVIKYGFPIGIASADIKKGERVHTENLKTALSGISEYSYCPEIIELPAETPVTVKGYLREDGSVGIRNDIWIIPTVGCVNKTAERLAEKTGAFSFTHPYGCSQLGDDQEITRKVLKGLIKHPNAAGVLVLGLGCENNNIEEMKKVLGGLTGRIRFLNAQDCEDEIEEGIKIINELRELSKNDKRTDIPVSKLKIGLKCGGSDGLSGITANPLCGRVADKLASMASTVVLTEVPEMFGAEQLLMARCETKALFDKTVSLVNDFKRYFQSYGQPVYENPSPGNKAGGITTLEDKSLGCTQKSGNAPVQAVIGYGDVTVREGLHLLSAPGNDLVASTALAVSGSHIVLFTTGRGTPFGCPVPTVKISSNSALAEKKNNWIDFNAGVICETGDITACGEALFDYVIALASGEIRTKNEEKGYRDIAIFKNGVTL